MEKDANSSRPTFRLAHRLPGKRRWRGFAAMALLPALFVCVQPGLAQTRQDAKPSKSSTKDDADEKRKGPEVSGYIQFHFNQPVGGNENRFRVQRARVSLEGEVNDMISYEMDIDPRAPDHAGTLRDAFFNIEYRPNHTLRLGQHKTKFGYINQRSSSRLYTVNRPEMADELSRGINLRDIGASLLGKHPMSPKVNFEYAVSLVNGAGMNVQRDNNDSKNVSGRIGLRSKGKGLKWRLGVSGAIGDLFEPENDPELAPGYFIDFKRLGTDFFLDHDAFDLNGEFAIGRREELGDKETVHGYYLTLVGKTSGPVGPVLSYDSINSTEDVRVTLGAYHGTSDEPFRVLVNYEFRGSTTVGRFYLWTLVRF